jgi:hypothetical protein
VCAIVAGGTRLIRIGRPPAPSPKRELDTVDAGRARCEWCSGRESSAPARPNSASPVILGRRPRAPSAVGRVRSAARTSVCLTMLLIVLVRQCLCPFVALYSGTPGRPRCFERPGTKAAPSTRQLTAFSPTSLRILELLLHDERCSLRIRTNSIMACRNFAFPAAFRATACSAFHCQECSLQRAGG